MSFEIVNSNYIKFTWQRKLCVFNDQKDEIKEELKKCKTVKDYYDVILKYIHQSKDIIHAINQAIRELGEEDHKMTLSFSKVQQSFNYQNVIFLVQKTQSYVRHVCEQNRETLVKLSLLLVTTCRVYGMPCDSFGVLQLFSKNFLNFFTNTEYFP